MTSFEAFESLAEQGQQKDCFAAADKRGHKAASLLDKITVLVLTYNEELNIGRTLEKLRWASRVLVVDSFSTDGTCDIVRKRDRAELLQREFYTHADQWNYGLAHIDTEWVLSLDADYQLTDSFISELKALSPEEAVDAYYVRFKYCIAGDPLRASLYPPRAILFRRSRCHYDQDGHTQVLRVHGQHRWLQSFIYHDDRKPLKEWLRAQDRYGLLEARHLATTSIGDLKVADQLRRWIVPAPFLVFFYTLFAKGLIADGLRGWYYVFQRTLAEILLSLRLIETKLNTRKSVN